MNRRSLLKLAGIGALVPVISKADAIRIEKGEEPKEAIEKMPTVTGVIREWRYDTADWARHEPVRIIIELENNADTFDLLHKYMQERIEVAVVTIIRGGL
jgi:hypothetical protein